MARLEPHLNVVLNPEAPGTSSARRLPSSAELAPFVQWFWSASWDRRGTSPHVVEILTDTAFHLVFEPAGSNVLGVVTRKFTRRLEGAGRVLGVKFRPAAFRPFTRRPASDFTDARIPLALALDGDTAAAQAAVLAGADDEARAAAAEAFLLSRLPPPDPQVAAIGAMVARIEEDRELTTVEALASDFHLGPRTVQRLFRDYLGVGPKWVIRRSRLLEAAERIRAGAAPNLAQLAASLGYFDQAHLAHEFKAVIGRTPTDYGNTAR
jgi:AraC-like DNA-binding protein